MSGHLYPNCVRGQVLVSLSKLGGFRRLDGLFEVLFSERFLIVQLSEETGEKELYQCLYLAGFSKQ